MPNLTGVRGLGLGLARSHLLLPSKVWVRCTSKHGSVQSQVSEMCTGALT